MNASEFQRRMEVDGFLALCLCLDHGEEIAIVFLCHQALPNNTLLYDIGRSMESEQAAYALLISLPDRVRYLFRTGFMTQTCGKNVPDSCERRGFVNEVELLAFIVLDKRICSHFQVIKCRPDDRGNGLVSALFIDSLCSLIETLECCDSSMARDNLVGPVSLWPHSNRLNESVVQNGAYELFELLFVGGGARLRRIALQEMNRDEEELLGRSVGRVSLWVGLGFGPILRNVVGRRGEGEFYLGICHVLDLRP